MILIIYQGAPEKKQNHKNDKKKFQAFSKLLIIFEITQPHLLE